MFHARQTLASIRKKWAEQSAIHANGDAPPRDAESVLDVEEAGYEEEEEEEEEDEEDEVDEEAEDDEEKDKESVAKRKRKKASESKNLRIQIAQPKIKKQNTVRRKKSVHVAQVNQSLSLSVQLGCVIAPLCSFWFFVFVCLLVCLFVGFVNSCAWSLRCS